MSRRRSQTLAEGTAAEDGGSARIRTEATRVMSPLLWTAKVRNHIVAQPELRWGRFGAVKDQNCSGANFTGMAF